MIAENLSAQWTSCIRRETSIQAQIESGKMIRFEELPVELKLKIFRYALENSTSKLTSSLKLTSREFYVFYNELFNERLQTEFGSEFVQQRLAKVIHFIRPYIESFDYWRKTQRQMVSKLMNLSPEDEFYKDSYQLVYSICKNRRLFATYEDYKIDEPSTYQYNNFVNVNKTYLLSYRKTITLTADHYNLACGIIVENVLGLSTTKFQVLNHETGEELLVYYPPSNINEILPKSKFVLLNLGDFKVVQRIPSQKLVAIDVIMEETGLYIKSGFSVCFIDVNVIQPNHTDHIIQVPVASQEAAQQQEAAVQQPPEPLHRSGSLNASNRSRRRSSISLNSTMTAVQTEDFNFHNFLFWYVENDADPPFQQNLCNLMLRNIYKALEKSLTETSGKVAMDPDEFDLTPYEDVENYNRNFFSKFCADKPNEKIKRIFKFITVIQQRNYDMEVAKTTKELELRQAMGLIPKDDYMDSHSPLKWKMQTILQL